MKSLLFLNVLMLLLHVPFIIFFIKTTQLVESEALSYIAGSGVSYYGHVVPAGRPF